MYDSWDDHFERHYDFFRDHDDYQAYMKGEEDGALPVDCGPPDEQNFLVMFEDEELFQGQEN